MSMSTPIHLESPEHMCIVFHEIAVFVSIVMTI